MSSEWLRPVRNALSANNLVLGEFRAFYIIRIDNP